MHQTSHTFRVDIVKALGALGFVLKAGAKVPSKAVDQKGFLSLAESLDKPSEDDQNALLEAFRVFDKSGMGMVPAGEFLNMASILGDPLTPEECEMLQAETSDGKLTYPDLVAKMG